MDPITRQEQYLNAIAGGDNDVPATPQTREEWFLNQILENGGGGDPEVIKEAVEDWLDDHIDPTTGYAVDNTLSITGAAADAKAAGDEIADLKSATSIMMGNVVPITDIGDPWTENGLTVDNYEAGKISIYGTASAARHLLILNGQKGYAWSSMTFAKTLGAGTYHFTVKATGNVPNGYTPIISYTTSTYANAQYASNGAELTFNAPVMLGLLIPKNTVYGTSGNPTYIELVITQYKEKANADETYSFLHATGDTTDRTADILAKLTTYGNCKLGKGNFYISNLTMPNSTRLSGQGDATKIYQANTATGSAITMGDNCTICDLDVYGASETLTLDGDIIGTGENTSATNLWVDGDKSVPSADGYTQFVLDTPIPAGWYKITANVTSDYTGANGALMAFSRSQTTTISGTSIFANVFFTPSTAQTISVYLSETAYSVRLCSANTVSASEGLGATWSDIAVRGTHSRSGIEWTGATVKSGMVSNCRIYSFDCAGIIGQETTDALDHNLMVSDCLIKNCNCGIYIRKNSEFWKIENCTVVSNWYGALIRGGNNMVCNCGFDGNKIGVQYDQDEGTNGGHGNISNCTINHADNNTGYGLIIRDTGRELVSNCNFYYSKIKLQNTMGNVISNCGAGSSSGLDISGGSCNIIIGCMVKGTGDFPITLSSNDNIKLVNCYTRGGAALELPA